MNEKLEVTANEVKKRLQNGEPFFLINLRHHEDWDVGYMKARGALRLNDNEVEKHLNEIPRDRPVAVYSNCPGDEPSMRAARLLLDHGWNDVHYLAGGFKAYCEEGLPVEEIGEDSTVKKVMLL